jgi:hypothetical protein
VEFTLYYQGRLRANARVEEKHTIRQYFHRQLKELWNQEPLNILKGLLINPNGPESIIRHVGPFHFAPLVSSRVDLLADLEITMLRPGQPGIISHGGDIDNRLKTLLDALKVPEPNALPQGATPGNDEQPFFCLVEDDRLITGISIKTDRLLDPSATLGEVMLLLHVKTKSSSTGWSAFGV